MKKISFVVAGVFLLAGHCFAGPFGLSMGQPASEIAKGITPNENGVYVVTTVLLPDSHFRAYGLFISEKLGLAKIIAIGNTVTTNPQGEQIRAEFAGMVELLTRKYGKPTILDYIHQSSTWKEPNQWTMAMKTKERTLLAYWQRKLPDNISAIGLQVSCHQPDEGTVTLTYEFSNLAAVVEERKSKE